MIGCDPLNVLENDYYQA